MTLYLYILYVDVVIHIYIYILLHISIYKTYDLDLLPPCLPAGHMKIHICPRIGNYSLFKELNIILFVKFSWKRYIYIIFWLHNIRLLSFWKRYNVVKSTVWSDLHKCLFLVTLWWVSRYYCPVLQSPVKPSLYPIISESEGSVEHVFPIFTFYLWVIRYRIK